MRRRQVERRAAPTTTCTAGTTYGAAAAASAGRCRPGPSPARPSSVGDQEVERLRSTMPLQANSATQPGRQAEQEGRVPARAVAARRSRAGVVVVIAPAPPGGRQGAVALQRGGLPAAAAQRTPWPAAPRRPDAVPGRDVQHHGVRRVAGCGQAGQQLPVGVAEVAEHGQQHAAVLGLVDPAGGQLLAAGQRRSGPAARAARPGSPPRAPWCQPCADERPVALTSRTSKSSATRSRMIDAVDADRASPSTSAGAVAAVGDAAVVDQQRAPRLPLLLLAPHHQLVDAGAASASGSGAGRRRGGTRGS